MKKNLYRVFAVLLAVAVMTTVSIGGTEKASAATTSGNAMKISTVEKDDDSVDLRWSEINGASGYEIYRYVVSSKEWIKIGQSSTPYFEADDLRSATIYKFRVRAIFNDGAYSEYSKTFSTCTRPKEADNFKVSSKTTSTVKLSWTSVSRATGYAIYRYNTSSATWKRIGTVKNATSYTVKNLGAGKTYKFMIKAYRYALGYNYFSESETLSVKTNSTTSGSATGTGLTGKEKAKAIAYETAGVGASKVSHVSAVLDYDDGIKVYEVSFHSGETEYEVEINANTWEVVSYDYESIYD